ncbi:MAG: MlaD family protein [Pseudomonadota bacterium]
METEKYYFRVGLFFLTGVAAFIYYLVAFGAGSDSKNMVRYAVYFDSSVAGLARGAPVKLKGIEVGFVQDIRFVSRGNDRILVTADIIDTSPIREDTVATVSFQGITGTTYLTLENTGMDKAPFLLSRKKDEKYPVIRSRKSDLQSALSSMPEVMGKLEQVVVQVQKLLNDKNIAAYQGLFPEAHDALTEATSAFREIRMLARTLREDPSIVIRGTEYKGYQVPK